MIGNDFALPNRSGRNAKMTPISDPKTTPISVRRGGVIQRTDKFDRNVL